MFGGPGTEWTAAQSDTCAQEVTNCLPERGEGRSAGKEAQKGEGL